MDWVKAHYDRVAVIAGALILLLCSVFIWRSASGFSETFVAAQAGPAPKKPAPPGKAADVDNALQSLQQPPQWTFSGRSGLFVPEKHFIGANGQPATLENTQVHAPVPNEWLEQFNLPIADADVLTQDPDNDGFNNLDEWQGHTNPTDKASHPAYVTKLKLKAFSQEPFRLKFTSWNPDTQTFEINEIDLKAPTQEVKIGDTLAGTHFKVVKFTEKHVANAATGGDTDVSELLIEHTENHSQLTLVLEKVATSPESIATFSYSWPATQAPEEIKVRKDQEFSLKPQEDIKYKLIDVQPTKAVIVNNQKPNEPIEIGLLAP
jgi:hypothetical protein